MTEILRKASAVWKGSLRKGNGNISTESNVLAKEEYNFGTRFGDESGTNPDELIAAAHAGCYAMAFSGALAEHGYDPQSVVVDSTIKLEKQENGFAITGMKLNVFGTVPDIDNETFLNIARQADQGCPVSNLLRPGLTIEIEAQLMS